jgi:hypothetical protein
VQVIQLWVRAKGAVVVTTTSKGERLKEYLAIERLGLCLYPWAKFAPLMSCVGPLTPEEVAAIDLAGALGPDSQLSGPVAGPEDGWRTKAGRYPSILAIILIEVLGFWTWRKLGE